MTLPRLQLFEFEDQAWLPDSIRSLVTDYLSTLLSRRDVYAPAPALLARLMRRTGDTRIVDLGSGSAGPLRWVQRGLAALGCEVTVLLTDKFPNPGSLARACEGTGGALEFHPGSVDATRVPREPAFEGLRTLFTSFHHFAPDGARAVLRDAVDSGAAIAVFEFTERRPARVAWNLLAPFLVWILTPWIRPFRWSRLLWTYVIPVAPVLICWDGVVSQLRSYTHDELRALAAAIAGGSAYEWEAGQTRSPEGGFPRGPEIRVTYLLGAPVPSATRESDPP